MMFTETPDVLIVPSDLMLLAKPIEGCICVNPSMLVKGTASGSFANFTINQFEGTQGETQSNQAIKRVRVDIVNI